MTQMNGVRSHLLDIFLLFKGLKREAAMFIASGPDKRITAMAPTPEAVAKATMVSLEIIK